MRFGSVESERFISEAHGSPYQDQRECVFGDRERFDKAWQDENGDPLQLIGCRLERRAIAG
jgi:hypothetical protein